MRIKLGRMMNMYMSMKMMKSYLNNRNRMMNNMRKRKKIKKSITMMMILIELIKYNINNDNKIIY